MDKTNSLGCGTKLKAGGLCGEANAWGQEYLCDDCDTKLRIKWANEEKRRTK